MYKVLLIAILFCIAETGFAKMQIDLQAQTRCPITPVEVFFDSQTLDVGILSHIGIIDVVIEDHFGNVVFRTSLNGTPGIVSLGIGLKKGEYVIWINSLGYKAKGDFFIE
ncbi:hypothetical protein [uncultured Parabacteroides sp.]|jgi:hypothetical protein|uniref:DUF3244 domain-containing protein n=1 Tax=uncultured Parabacteroides sp. TaxID=512312 RepID=UPI0025CEAAF4|nr:hypothetical protein [uncultured Parabacteroides sp.]